MSKIKTVVLSYIITTIAFLTLDFTWLSLTSARLYQPMLSAHLSGQYDWRAVALFYPLYFVGVTFFAIRPLHQGSALHAALRGILLGAVAYGTYDLTNQATFSAWPWTLTGIDMAWGCFATGIASWCTSIILKKITVTSLSQTSSR